MSTVVAVALVAVVAVVLVLAIGGYVANARRQRERHALLMQQISDANDKLAAARAEDKGWERSTMESAARAAAASRTAGIAISELHLVQVVDRPGTDADEAVFRIVTADGAEHTVKLGRRDGAWVPAS